MEGLARETDRWAHQNPEGMNVGTPSGFSKDMLPHDDNLAFGPDKIAIGKWAKGNPVEAAACHYPHRREDWAGSDSASW